MSPLVAAGGVVNGVNATEGSIGYAALPDIEANKSGDTAALRLQNNGLSNKLVNAQFASPLDEEDANCANAQYKVPLGGRVGESGENVDWSQVFGADPNAGGENYPLCTLTFDLALKSYSSAGFSEGAAVTVSAYLSEFITAEPGRTP